MRNIYFYIIILVCFHDHIDGQSSLRNGKDYALFFIETKFDYGWESLQGTEKDVEALAQELETNYGFKAEIHKNQTLKQIKDILGVWKNRQYENGDQLLVYFSTHGVLDEANRGALIPKDGKKKDDTYQSWLTYDDLRGIVQKMPCEHILLALDACYSGAFRGSSMYGNPSTTPWEEGREDCKNKIKNSLAKKTRLFLTSAGKNPSPIESAFAKKWFETLVKGDGVTSFYDLYAKLRTITPTPEHGPFFFNEDGGNIVFVRNNACEIATIQKPVNQDPFTIISKNQINIHGGVYKTKVGVSGEQIRGFSISKFEVTVDEFRKFVDQSHYLTDAEKQGRSVEWRISAAHEVAGLTWRQDVEGREIPADKPCNYPVIRVSWNDAQAYCNWLSRQTGLNYRLPTQGEWQYAATGGKDNEAWSGTGLEQQLGLYANYWMEIGDTYVTTSPVGSFLPNGFGLYDMSGNVWEWCAGDSKGEIKPRCGGSWSCDEEEVMITSVRNDKSEYQNYNIGFRVVLGN
jgi:hypothetical protein